MRHPTLVITPHLGNKYFILTLSFYLLRFSYFGIWKNIQFYMICLRGFRNTFSSSFSYVGDINAYLNIDNQNENDISFDARNAHKQPMEGAYRNPPEAEMQHFVESLQCRFCD